MQNTAFNKHAVTGMSTDNSAPYVGFYLDILVFSIIIGTVLAVMMLSDFPGLDLPDIKDIPALFPNYCPA
jgi:hypothetical protein